MSSSGGPRLRERLLVVGVAFGFGLLILGAAAYPPLKATWDLDDFRKRGITDLGAAVGVCDPVVTRPASGAQEHVDAGAHVAYPYAPPAFGPHDATPDPMERKFYSGQDRPTVERLVHNLEHGYTVVWYDDTVAQHAGQVELLRAIADQMQGTGNPLLKVKIVPWTSADGAPFPDGRHVAETHWSRGGQGVDDTDHQVGVWQYCSRVSGAALNEFMLAYPPEDSPEPTAP